MQGKRGERNPAIGERNPAIGGRNPAIEERNPAIGERNYNLTCLTPLSSLAQELVSSEPHFGSLSFGKFSPPDPLCSKAHNAM